MKRRWLRGGYGDGAGRWYYARGGDAENPGKATTYGVGEMIRDAVSRGYRKFIIGIGGSATNDGGIGMLRALGVKFLTKDGEEAGEGADALGKIHFVSLEHLMPELKECDFQIACDVTNPLCGEKGATYIYGKQKGIREEEMPRIDADMKHYAAITAERIGVDYAAREGAGAAGGMGYAFISYLGARLVPGIELILDVIHFEEEAKKAQIVLTGEGRLDLQTAMGKAPVGVARAAKKYGCKVIAFAGSVTKEAAACNDNGIDAFFPIVRGTCTLEEAMQREKSHGESHRFSGTGISSAIISPILQDDLEERLSQKSGMKEQVIREIDLDKRFKKKCWGNQVLPSPLTVLPAVCRR